MKKPTGIIRCRLAFCVFARLPEEPSCCSTATLQPLCARRDFGRKGGPLEIYPFSFEWSNGTVSSGKESLPVLCLSRTQRRIRPWLAMVATYALSLQLVLSGLVPGHFHIDNALAGDAIFAIFHGSNDQDWPRKPAIPLVPCNSCTFGYKFS